MPTMIMAGGGIVPIKVFIFASGIACLFASLFVMAGRSLLSPLKLFQQDKISNLGYYYFMGLCPFLVALSLFTRLNLTYTQSLALTISLMLGIAIFPYYKKKKSLGIDFYKVLLHTSFWVFFIGYFALFLLNIIARDRGGPIYAEAAQYIIETNSLPLINRHYGQSILAALILGTFKEPTYTLAQICVNIWLPLSQAFLMLIVYHLTENTIVKKSNRLIVCFVAFAGNCALSLLPYIPSDHDFPLICNVYADSVIGLGVAVIVISIYKFLIQAAPLKNNQLLLITALLYFLLAALNVTAELNLLVITSSLLALNGIAFIQQRNWKPLQSLIVTLVAASLALASCHFMGGIFMPKTHVQILENRNKALFNDSSANAAITTLTPTNPVWWYIPYVLPGFYIDYGNYNSIFDGEIVNKSLLNDKVMQIKDDDFLRDKIATKEHINYLSTSVLARAIYLAEMRLGTLLKVLFWPSLALVVCIWLLTRSRRNQDMNSNMLINLGDSSSLLNSKTGISFSIFSFLIALSIIPINSNPGDILNWRWALTRFNEIGLFLMMIYMGIFSVGLLGRVKSSFVRVMLTIILLGIFSGGVLVRLFIYPTLNGYR